MNKLYSATLVAASMAIGATAQAPSKAIGFISPANTFTSTQVSFDRGSRMEVLGKHAGAFHAPPTTARGGVANDDCADAETISVVALADCATSATAGDNGSASNGTEEPSCDPGSTAGYQDVWYTFDAGTNASVFITLTPGDDTVQDWAFVVYDGCGGTEVICAVAPSAAVSVAVTPGSVYYLRVYSNLDFGVGGPFTLCVAGTGAAAPNDECTGAVNQDLAVGSTVTFTGDNTGATSNDSLDMPAVWEMFTTTECSNLVVDYCGTTPAFGNGYTSLFYGCPQTGSMLASSFTDTLCPDGNFSLFFTDVPAGTYYYAVMQDAANSAIGPYTINVAATACIPHTEYCIPTSANGTTDGDYIGTFELGDIYYSGANDSTYVDNSALTTDLAIGGTYTATITGGAYAPDAYAAWIDYNNNFLFDPTTDKLGETATVADSGEVVTIEFTVPPGTTLGAKRLRVRGVYNTGGNTDPCVNYAYGETEDYTVNIVLGSGISQLDQSSVNVFPNPSKGDIAISGADLNGKVSMEITDMTGRTVFAEQYTMSANQPVTLPLNGKLAQGTYTLRLISANGISSRPVMIK